MVKRPTVAIVYRCIPHYRLAFYEQLRHRLEREGIELRLIYGQTDAVNASKKDTVEIEWAHRIENRMLRVGRQELCWQPCLHLLRGVDLIIVEQASRLLLNYLLLAHQMLRKHKVAYWGHGKKLQAHTASRLGETLKDFMSRHVHWWFAYNELSKRIVLKLGFPEACITDVQNAIDTAQLSDIYHRVTTAQVEALRAELGLQGDDVCIYIGGMYGDKRLDFLLEAARLIKQQRPGFEMLFLGAGEQAALVKEASLKHDWVHYVGPVFEAGRVPYFKLSKLLLMPGLVGLAILDAFCMETPLVTTNVPYHSPEIAYLQPGINGVMVEKADSVHAFAQAVVELLEHEAYRQQLVLGGRRASQRYTMEEMVDRFTAGVMQALSLNSQQQVTHAEARTSTYDLAQPVRVV